MGDLDCLEYGTIVLAKVVSAIEWSSLLLLLHASFVVPFTLF
jgi:hypothetical protein